MKRTLLYLAVLVVLLPSLPACKSKDKKTSPKSGEKIYPVSVTPVVNLELPDAREVKGLFVPSDKLDVKSELEGKVLNVAVNEGQNVTMGELLATINPETLQLLLEKEKAELKEVELKLENPTPSNVREVKRPEGPRTPENPQAPVVNPTPEAEAAQAETQKAENTKPENAEEEASAKTVGPERNETQIRVDEATLDRLKTSIAFTEKKLEFTNITSGISGMVAHKNITDGSVVALGEILFQVVRIDPILFSMSVDKQTVLSLKKEQRLDVMSEDMPGYDLTGDIVYISPEADTQSHRYEVRISLPNTQQKIKAGMAGKAFIPLNESRNTLVIPEAALVQKDGKAYVYVLKGTVAERRSVELGIQHENKVEVTKGVKEGEEVVVKGHATFDEDEEFVKKE